MLTIICGEDTGASRTKFTSIKQSYETKGFRVQNVVPSELPDILKSNEGVLDLFGQESVYAVENISSLYKGRGKSDFKTAVDTIAKHQTIHVIDWENGKSAYELTTLKKLTGAFYESKPAQSVFDLLDLATPGKMHAFLKSLQIVLQTQEAMFIYTLLWRHIRKLILAAEGHIDAKASPWQRGKIQAQAKSWSKEKLVGFYEGLAKIDFSMKTSSSTFDIRESIEILACYYLK